MAVLSRERLAVVKMDGWPEIKTRLSTKEEVLDTPQIRRLAEVVRDQALAVLRGCQTNVNLEELEDVFMVFKRSQREMSVESNKVKNRVREIVK